MDGMSDEREKNAASGDRMVIIAGKKVRFIDPMSDWGFKRLFGYEDNKEILLAFLNDLLPDKEITEIRYTDAENPGMTENKRKAVFDVICETETGEKFIVEVQKKNQAHFRDRALFYSSFRILNQAPKGEWDYALNPVYMVGVLGFKMQHELPTGQGSGWKNKRAHRYGLTEEETGETMSKNLNFIFLEVGAFSKDADDLDSDLDKWMFLLKNLPTLTDIPPCLQSGIFRKVIDTAEIAAFTAEEKIQYERNMMTENDYRNTIEFAAMEGEVRGEARGEAKGRAMAAAEMKKLGLDVAIISKSTGLSVEDIAKL